MSVNVSGAGRAYFGRDNDGPELRYSAGGNPYMNFSIGFYQGKDKDTGYINAVVFGELAENLAGSLEDGDSVTFSGVLDHSKYTTKDGQSRTSLKVRVFECGASLRWGEVHPMRINKAGGSRPAAAKPQTFDQQEAPF